MIKKQASKAGGHVRVTFVLPEHHNALPASVVGEFNGWDPFVHPLKRRSNRTWSASVDLEPGRKYRFRYLGKDGRWFDDDSPDLVESDGAGHRDCVVLT